METDHVASELVNKPPLHTGPNLDLHKQIACILYAHIEDFQRVAEIDCPETDAEVSDSVAADIMGTLIKRLDPVAVRIADLVYKHCNKHTIPIPDRLPERIKEIFIYGEELNG
jgi:hypothetical protein